MTSSPPAPTDAVADSVAATLVELKPTLRGWLHAYAAAISVLGGVALFAVAFALRGPHAGWPTAIYALTVTALFGTSALYHRLHWSPRGHLVMKRLDHSMIFVFIAGTYTPLAVLTLPNTPAIAVLAVVWSGALFGVALKTAWPAAPRWLSVPCYVGLGWVAVFVFPDLLHRGGVAAFVLIAAGGVIYTLGAVVYALKRPNPLPGVFGFHEVFHACTLLAASCHYIAIWFAVFA
jgi:hemolysin III